MTSIFLLSVLRSLIISTIIVIIARKLYQTYLYSSGPKSKALLIFSLLPLIIPPLLPAYAYSSFKINTQTSPVINEVLYAFITTARFLPYTLIFLYLLNYSKDNSANTCDQLSPGKKISLIHKHAPLLLSSILPFLLCLHEYEVASLMRIKHWSIEVFNAHSGGLAQTMWGSFKMVSLPFFMSVAALFLAYYLQKFCTVLQTRKDIATFNRRSSTSLIVLSSLICISFVVPMAVVTYTGLMGFSEVFSSSWMLKETLNSLSFAVIATICSGYFSQFLLSSGKVSILVALSPGLCGTLVLGLITLNIFQFPILISLNHTVVPLTIAYVFYGLPLSLILNFVYQKNFRNSSIKAANLLPENERAPITWRLKTLPFIICQFPVFCLLWFELTLNTLLAPSSMPGIFPRLYNLMHYNENEKLSATVAVAVFIPPIILAMTLMISRIGTKWTNKLSGN